MVPASKSAWAPPRNAAPPTTVMAPTAPSGRRQRASGASRASSASRTRSRNGGAERSGRSFSAVQIAFAWTSAPAISSSPPTGVECTSRSVGAVPPTITMRPRMRSSATRPSITSENETVGIVPGGPRKSIQALPSRNPDGSGRAAGEALGGGDGDALEAGRGAREARDRAARVVLEVRGGGQRVDAAQVLVAAEHVRAALAVALARREHGAAGVRRSRRTARGPGAGSVGSVNWTS